jgi:hypothetical protein
MVSTVLTMLSPRLRVETTTVIGGISMLFVSLPLAIQGYSIPSLIPFPEQGSKTTTYFLRNEPDDEMHQEVVEG